MALSSLLYGELAESSRGMRLSHKTGGVSKEECLSCVSRDPTSFVLAHHNCAQVFGAINPWIRPFRESYEPLCYAQRLALKTGDIEGKTVVIVRREIQPTALVNRSACTAYVILRFTQLWARKCNLWMVPANDGVSHGEAAAGRGARDQHIS